MSRLTSTLAVTALLATASTAFAQDNEVMIVGNYSETGSSFYQLAYTHDISSMGADGLGVRVDLAHGSYDTFYDNTDGTAETQRARLMLRYSVDLAPTAVVTLSGGVSYEMSSVSPDTANSPDDATETGYVAAVDLYWLDNWNNALFATAETDTVGADYYSARYLVNFGAFSVGPTANYIIDGDYARRAFGASVEVPFASGGGEVLATLVATEAEFGGGGSSEENYFEVLVRMEF